MFICYFLAKRQNWFEYCLCFLDFWNNYMQAIKTHFGIGFWTKLFSTENLTDFIDLCSYEKNLRVILRSPQKLQAFMTATRTVRPRDGHAIQFRRQCQILRPTLQFLTNRSSFWMAFWTKLLITLIFPFLKMQSL